MCLKFHIFSNVSNDFWLSWVRLNKMVFDLLDTDVSWCRLMLGLLYKLLYLCENLYQCCISCLSPSWSQMWAVHQMFYWCVHGVNFPGLVCILVLINSGLASAVPENSVCWLAKPVILNPVIGHICSYLVSFAQLPNEIAQETFSFKFRILDLFLQLFFPIFIR